MRNALRFLLCTILLAALPATAAGPHDFNADGKPDLVMHNATSGNAFIWKMDGATLIADQFLASVDPTWTLAGTGDFNGDGHTDVVWRDAGGAAYVWYLDNGAFVSSTPFFSIAPEWKIGAVADFSGDGKPDLLMWNARTGLAFIWTMDGIVPTGDQFLFQVDTLWKVESVADYNNDGRPDLLFRHALSGLGFAWYTQRQGPNVSLAGSSAPIFSIDPGWEVVQSADWNADGKPDLVFRNVETGVIFVWYLDGAQLAGSASITQIDTSWDVVPRASSGSCPAVPRGRFIGSFGGEGTWQQDFLASGEIGTVRLVDPLPADVLGGIVTYSQTANTPSPMNLEIALSQCPGDLAYGKKNQVRSGLTPCYQSSTNPSGLNINWHTTVSTHFAYCHAPAGTGPWYLNMKLSYPSCPWGAFCGLSRQWNRP